MLTSQVWLGYELMLSFESQVWLKDISQVQQDWITAALQQINVMKNEMYDSCVIADKCYGILAAIQLENFSSTFLCNTPMILVIFSMK